MNVSTKAVAIKYDSDLPAPFILAKGKGDLARRLTELAQEAGIPVSEDPAIIDALYSLEVGEFIPEDLYNVVARLLVFAYQLEMTSR